MKERRETILINFIDGSFGFIFCGNWIFKYTFSKLICKSIVPNMFRKQRGPSIKKIIRRQVKTGKKKPFRHEEEAYCSEKNSFKLSAAENSTEISGQLRKWNFLSLIIKAYEGFLLRREKNCLKILVLLI